MIFSKRGRMSLSDGESDMVAQNWIELPSAQMDLKAR